MFQVSHSKIKTYRSCQKAYAYRYFEGLKRKAPPLPLLRGSALGEMLDARALGNNPLDVLKKYEKQYCKLFREEKEMYGDFVGDLRRIYEGYAIRYKDERLTYLEVELELKFPLIDGIEFIGYIDKLVKDADMQRWDMDHKSHRSIPDEDARYSDIQQVLYAWGYNLLQKKESKKLSGIIWDYIRTKPPAIPEQLKNGELTKRMNIDTTYETFMGEIRRLKKDPKDYKTVLTMLKNTPNQFYQRVKLPLSNNTMVDMVVKDLKNTALQIRKHTDDPKRLEKSVRNLGHNCPQCEFFELCSAELRGYDSSFIRKTKFVTREESDDFNKARKIKAA